MDDEIKYRKVDRIAYEPEGDRPLPPWPAPPVALWACPTCRQVYDTPDRAAVCEAQGREWETPVAKVGELVVTGNPSYGRFGWFDGDRDWVIEREDPEGRGIEAGILYDPIYVVAAVLPAAGSNGVTNFNDAYGSHAAHYYLITAAFTGDKGYRFGWTSKDHYRPYALDPIRDKISPDRLARLQVKAAELAAAAPLSAYKHKTQEEMRQLGLDKDAGYKRWGLL